jgi:hypothetical protein
MWFDDNSRAEDLSISDWCELIKKVQ